jgi:hypothetical protein
MFFEPDGWLHCKGIGYIIVSPEDMMKFKDIKLLLKLSNLLMVRHHTGITRVRFPHDLVGDKLRVTTDIKLLDPKLGGDA